MDAPLLPVKSYDNIADSNGKAAKKPSHSLPVHDIQKAQPLPPIRAYYPQVHGPFPKRGPGKVGAQNKVQDMEYIQYNVLQRIVEQHIATKGRAFHYSSNSG